MARGKSDKPRRLPPPRSLSGHRRQLSHVAEQLLRALNRVEGSRADPSPVGVQIVRDIVDVVIESATLATDKHSAKQQQSGRAFANTHGDGAPVRGESCIDTADARRHGERSPIRSKKYAPDFGNVAQQARASPSHPQSKPSPPKEAVVDPHTPPSSMPKSKNPVEVVDEDATDDEVIFQPKSSARPKHARAGSGAGMRPAAERSATKRKAVSKSSPFSSPVSSPVARKPARRRTQGAGKIQADEKRHADHSAQTANRQSSGRASTSTKRLTTAKKTRPIAANKSNPPAEKLKPSKLIAKRSAKSTAIASTGRKSKQPANSEEPPPSTKAFTRRLVKQSSKTQRKSTRHTRSTPLGSHTPKPDGRHKRNQNIRKEPEERAEPAEAVAEPRICNPPLFPQEQEEPNYPHSDISSDVDLDIENTACSVCSELGDYAKMVLCDACAAGCHIYCMQPSRTSIPLGAWLCPSCHTVAKRHHIHLSRMVVLRGEQRCYECVKRNMKTYNFKSPVKKCSDCELVFHNNCLRRFHNVKNADIHNKDWTCEVCLAAQEKRKEEEATMLAKQRARLAQKRARAKRPRLSAPYIGGAVTGTLRQEAHYRNSKPATFVATSFPPPVPIGNPPHSQGSDIMTDSPTPLPSEEQAAKKAADQTAEPIRDHGHSSPRPRIEVSISTDDRVKRNTQRGYGTSQDPVGPMRPAPMPPNGHGGNSQSRTTSIPVVNSADIHTSAVRREAPNATRVFSNQINSMPSAPQGGIPRERRVTEEITDTHEMRHKVRAWNENVQNSVNDMFRYHEPSPGRRPPIVTSAKSKSRSKLVTTDDTIPAALYNSNVLVGMEQDRMFSSVLPTASQGSNRVQNDAFPQTYDYGRWQGAVSQETDLRQDPRGYQPRDSVPLRSPPRPPLHAPSSSRPPLPEDHIRFRLSPPGPTLRLDGNQGPPVGSSVPERNQRPERNVYQSAYQIPSSSSFDPSALRPYPSASETHKVAAPARFPNEALRDIPSQEGNAPKQIEAALVLSERNAKHNHGAVTPPETARYAMNPSNRRHSGASEPHRERTSGSVLASIQMNDRMTGNFELTAQQRSESCDPSDIARRLERSPSERPVNQSQSSGQAALMRTALTQAANHVGYSQCHAQNGNDVARTRGYRSEGGDAEQMTSVKGFPGEHLECAGEPRPRKRADNANVHVTGGGAKSTVSVAEKGADAPVNSAPLSPAPLQKPVRQSKALEERSPKGAPLGSSGVVENQDEPEFVESGSLRAWIMLNICPRKRFHGSMFLDMPYRSYFSGAVRVLYDESRSLRVIAFSKFDCETSHCRLKEWWVSNRSHFSLAPEHFPDEVTLTTACLSEGFRLDVL